MEDLANYGHCIGVAFQMKDDLFDYGRNKIGKPTGNDIREKKITLPLLYTLQNATPVEKRKIIRMLKKRNKKKEQVRFIIDKVLSGKGIEYTEGKMNEYIEKAKHYIKNYPESDSKTALLSLAEFIGMRKF